VLEIVEADELLDRHPVVQRSIRLRNPYVDPMNAIQVELLRRYRTGDDAVVPPLLKSIAGIAAACGTPDEVQVEREAAAAADAVAALSDDSVTRALERAAVLVDERHDAIAAANGEDVAPQTLDEGALDRLRLNDERIAALGAQLSELAALPALERAEDAWELENGLHVSVVRIPIGAVGANFEARPNVAVDVAGQLLKSLNGVVLRTGGAALRTVTVLVDEVLRPALADTGLPPQAVGLVRSPDREGARILVSLPTVLPLVILRGSGETTAALAREAATPACARWRTPKARRPLYRRCC